MNNDAAEIKQRLNVVDVLGGYIRLEKAGSNWRALCPFHNEKSPSFMVSEEKQFWHCFGCQKSGDIFDFVSEMEGLEFREALKVLAEKAGVKLSGYDPKKTESKNRTLEILELAAKWYQHQLWEGPGKTKILAYLRGRGLEDKTIKEFRLGYAPRGWRNIIGFLNKRGYGNEEIIRAGLVLKKENSADFYDRFRERIMFPIADYSGRVVGYSARVAPGGDESQAKYVNTPETEVYHKSRVLYGIDKARTEMKKNNFALLVEGNMDVIACHQAGIANTVAVSGTALTQEQIQIIKRYAPKVKMFFDMDSAGQQATKKSLKLCLENEISVEVVSLSGQKDAADAARENPEALKSAVENSRSALDYIFQRNMELYDRKEVEGKKKITEEILEIISSLANAVEKSHWIKKLSEVVEVSEDALTNMLKEANLRERIASKENSLDDGKIISQKSRTEILKDELLGICFSSSSEWKEACSEKFFFASEKRDKLFEKAFLLGEKFGFDFEKFLEILDPDEKKRAEKLCFRKKYRLGLNNSLEEFSSQDLEKELREIIRNLAGEKKKNDLKKIAKDLKTAEEKKDQAAAVFLRTEFKRISGELAELSSA